MLAILEKVVQAGEALAGWEPAKDLFRALVEKVTGHAADLDSIRQTVEGAVSDLTGAYSAIRTDVTTLVNRVKALEAKVPTPAPNDGAHTVLVAAKLNVPAAAAAPPSSSSATCPDHPDAEQGVNGCTTVGCTFRAA